MLIFRTRSHECLAACEGALLFVDASQGIEEAQTLANIQVALEKMICHFEQVGLAHCGFRPCSSRNRRLNCTDIVRFWAKAGRGLDDTGEAIVQNIQPKDKSFGALIFDSHEDSL
jgi:translation elongation factor EF-4